MTLGTIVVSAILIVIVAAIIISMVRSHRAGKPIGCNECGTNCGGGVHDTNCGCANIDSMIGHMNDAVKDK